MTGVQTCALPIWANAHKNNDEALANKRVQDWKRSREYVLGLMGSDSTEDHLKAAIITFMLETDVSPVSLARSAPNRMGIAMSGTAAMNAATKHLYKMYADEVLEYVPVEVGVVPNTDYTRWLFNDEKENMMKQAKGEM